MDVLKRAARQQHGFTLVELLIVVIILAILAAIVVPQFSSSTDDAKLSALDTSLANLRAAVDLYYQQHGHYPGSAVATGATCATGAAVTAGVANSPEAFIAQLTRYTDVAGTACTGKSAAHKFGPYLKKDTLPTNPVTNNATLVISSAGVLGMTSAVTTGGWKFDVITGQLIADHSAYDDR